MKTSAFVFSMCFLLLCIQASGRGEEGALTLASIDIPRVITIPLEPDPNQAVFGKIKYIYKGPPVALKYVGIYYFYLTNQMDGEILYFDIHGNVIESALELVKEHGSDLFFPDENRSGMGIGRPFFKNGMKKDIVLKLLSPKILESGNMLSLFENKKLGSIVVRINKIKVCWELDIKYSQNKETHRKGEFTLDVGREVKIDLEYKKMENNSF